MTMNPEPDHAASGPVEEGPSAGTPEDGERPVPESTRVAGGPAVEPGRPLWTAFLTPAAVLLGSLVIGAAIGTLAPSSDSENFPSARVASAIVG